MAPININNSTLRNTSFPDLANYFKHLLSQTDQKAISDHLLTGLALDALPLRVLGVWLAGFADASSIAAALRFGESAGVRRLAIKRFGKCLRQEKQLVAIWSANGGTAGMLELFSDLSVHDVQSFCDTLGRSSAFDNARQTRQQLLTEFVESLLPEHFSAAKYRNPEVRPLRKFYANIVPACTAELIQAWEGNDSLPRAGGRWMDHAHYRPVRARCISQLAAGDGKDFEFKRFRNLIRELPPLAATRYMSESMAFSLEFLDYLGEHSSITHEAKSLIDDVIYPLLRRLARRKAPVELRVQVLWSIQRALVSRLKKGDRLRLSPGPENLVEHALRCWRQQPETHEALLISMCQLIPRDQLETLDTVASLMRNVHKEKAYALLRLLLQNLRFFSKDVDDDDDIKTAGTWPVSLFAKLPSNQAFELLQRLVQLQHRQKWQGSIFTILETKHAVALLDELLRVRPGGDFINWTSLTPQPDSVFFIEKNQSIALLRLYISETTQQSLQSWQTVIAQRKREAERARDQEDRAQWARAALLCSIATNDQECYHETLVWARRFNKDYFTVRALYSVWVSSPSVTHDLICGVPRDVQHAALTVDDVRTRVVKGNVLMLTLLETAFQALKEPSFYAPDWTHVLALFGEVTALRLERAPELQKKLACSDVQTYRIFHQDAIPTLVWAESQCLKEEHRKLQVTELSGILGQSRTMTLKGKCAANYQFLDDLARKRDKLWEKYRRSQNSEAVRISAKGPWPEGTTFQDSLSVVFEEEGYAQYMPFLMSRAESIVFLNSSAALGRPPGDKATRKAIGPFVDDYHAGLRFYVRGGMTGSERDRRRDRAWAHALKWLTGNRMTDTEATHFWKEQFKSASVSPPSSLPSELQPPPDPRLPAVDDPADPTEWHPQPEEDSYSLESRELAQCNIDCMFMPHTYVPPDVHVAFHELPPSTVEIEQLPLWQDVPNRRMKTIKPEAREALLALGILLINSKCCSSKRLLSAPFPSSQDPRFPALFLDEEFLDSGEADAEEGFAILERLSRDAPLTIIAELCESMLTDLGQGDDGSRMYEEETLRLLKILVDSDRPNIALNLVKWVVIDRPDASSWHRHMLTKGLFDRLQAEKAREFLLELATSIQDRLQEQAKRKAIPNGETAASTSSLIKVTTVTALAQLMANATFLSGEETVDILSNVFTNASHPDIRVAIVQSLSSILKKSRDEGVKTKVIDAIEQHAIPVMASSLNERLPMTEEDWQRAEREMEVPEVLQPMSKAVQPVLSAVLDAYGLVSPNIAEQIFLRILMPVLETSMQNNTRWLRIFLRKHGFDLDINTLPPVPPKPCLLHQMTRRAQPRTDLVVAIFTIWGNAIQANLSPQNAITAVNDHFHNDVALRTSNDGQHWLSLWHNQGTAPLTLGGKYLHLYLTSTSTDSTKPLPLIRDFVLRQLDVLIAESDERFDTQNAIINHLARPRTHIQAHLQRWEEEIRPLVEDLIKKIDSIRTRQWQRDPNRKPLALRDTYEMRLWLLTYPCPREDSRHDSMLAKFIIELQAELEDIAASEVPGDDHFSALWTAALKADKRDYRAIAASIGGIAADKVNKLQCLRVEMANMLFFHYAVDPENADDVGRAAAVVRLWKGSEHEHIRMHGLRLARKIEEEQDGRMRWLHRMTGNVT